MLHLTLCAAQTGGAFEGVLRRRWAARSLVDRIQPLLAGRITEWRLLEVQVQQLRPNDEKAVLHASPIENALERRLLFCAGFHTEA